MASLSDLYSDLRRYRSLSSSVSQVISNLTNSINNLEPASSNIASYYSIDEMSADLKKVISVRNELIQKKNLLSGPVMSAIESKISRIQTDIRLEEERIERERQEAMRRQEEELRQQSVSNSTATVTQTPTRTNSSSGSSSSNSNASRYSNTSAGVSSYRSSYSN